jgi:glutamate-1-semialdehyde 2,1-aminomutase
LDEFDRYRSRTRASADLYGRATKVMPGGICHTIRFFEPYPIYVEEARGARMRDVDGNEYVDFWMGHGALILGHTPGTVIEGLRDQARRGCHWGTVNRLQVELAELLVDVLPSAELVRFCNTGAEATTYACRLARGYTGRRKIAKIEGGWHGFNPDLMASIHHPLGQTESLGLNRATEDTLSLPFNDIESSLKILDENRGDLAAVILEPVLGSGGFIPAELEYLKALREATANQDALLIYDEVITGFRLSIGGAQQHFGIIPDLTTLGKILGGGLPVGAIAGREDVLGMSDAVGRARGDFVAIGGGTFSGNPMTMRAGLETLGYLKSHPEIYERIGRFGQRARHEIESRLVVDGRHVICTGIGSLFRTHFAFEKDEIRSARDAFERTDRDLQKWFKIAMANRGIFLVEGGGAVSAAHCDADMAVLEEACESLSP